MTVKRINCFSRIQNKYDDTSRKKATSSPRLFAILEKVTVLIYMQYMNCTVQNLWAAEAMFVIQCELADTNQGLCFPDIGKYGFQDGVLLWTQSETID